MPLALPYIIAAVATAVTVAVASPTINKCCAHGEILQPITLDCRPISAQKEREATWIPVVFSPARQNFLVSVPQEWKIEAPRRPSPCPSPMVHRADPAAPSFVLFANGSLVLPSPPLGLLHPDKFCLDAARESENTEMELAAIVCLPGKDPPVSSESIAPNPEEDNHAGVRKCCGDGAAFNGTTNACAVDVTETGNWSAPRPLRTLAGFPLCSKGEFVLMEMELREPYASVSTEDGSLKLISSTVPPEEFCVERVVVHSKDGGADHAPVSPPRLFVCPGFIPTAAPADHHDLRYTLYPVGLIFSAFFLAATLAVGCLLPKAHHALHWRCQTGHVASLLVGYVLLAGTQIAGPSVKPGPCVALGVFMHYFFLAAFFWLNTMCFNIWWTFRNSPLSLIETLGAINNSVDHLFEEENPNVIMISKHRRAEQKNNMRLQLVLNDICLHVDPQDISQRDLRPASLDKGQELCRFRAYSLYAWGVPLLITGLGISLDLAATEKQKGGPLRPRFGELRCWFYGDMEIFAYFFGPVGVLLLVNLILFLATARELTCGLWRREVAKSSPHGEGADRATLGRVCLKLVVVMGVTWVADVISWAVGGPSHVWYATDLINAFQGVLIFAVVGCQPQVWTAIRRMWCFRGVGGNGGHRRRELGDRAVHDDDDDYDESGAVGRFCRGGAGGGVTSSGRPVSSTTSEAGPLGSSPPHSLTWEGEVSHRENSIHRNANSAGIKPNEKQLVEDKETLC